MPKINLSQKNISLDLQHTGYTNTIYAQQDDINSRQLTISLFDDGKEYLIPNDATVSLCGTRADKTVIYRDVNNFNNNLVIIDFENAELAAKGTAKYKIEIKTRTKEGQTQILTSSAFKIKVYENIYDENEKLASPQYSDLQRELDKVHEVTQKAIDATTDLQNKLDSHHFVLSEDKDVAGGVPSLDNNTKVPISELYEATTSTKGITQLTDSVTSTSTTTAATPNSVKKVNDNLEEEVTRAKTAEDILDSKKAPLSSPTLTGTPKAPTASAGTNTTQIATTAFTQTAVSNHNTSNSSHTDIRDLITGLTNRLNALADSDDTTLDQLSEIVAYIKSNKTLIENVTTNKVNVSDIVNNLTSTHTNKPLSANQGKILKGFIDKLESALDNLEIGGRNLVLNSNVKVTSSNYGFAFRPLTVQLEPNTVYVLSANGRTNEKTTDDGKYLTVFLYASDWSWMKSLQILEHQNTTKHLIFTTPSDISEKEVTVASYYYPRDGDNTGSVTINWYKLEKGNKPTDWTPAPEDKAETNHTHTKSEITDLPTSMPASDVYSWAKESSKPSYSWSEIIDKPSTFAPSSHTHNYLPLSGGTVKGLSSFTAGLKVSGRLYNGGDDEGIVIEKASNGYAGLILGNPGGLRSAFYLNSNNEALWRYNNGTNSYDIYHPGKSGTIALTSDIPTKVSQFTNDSGYITGITKSMVTTALGYTPPTTDTNTHYTTKLKVGSSATAKTNTAASNGNVYLNVLDDSTIRDSHKIVGSGSTTVTSDANGVITIHSSGTSSSSIYETGTWTPTVGYQGSNCYTLSSGTYIKVGDIVYCFCQTNYSSKTGTENIYINTSSLPFTLDNGKFISGTAYDGFSSPKVMYYASPIQSITSNGSFAVGGSNPTIYITFCYRI